ncbi:MAG: helix-turn-helix domain-containing protein [Gemmobacter sp.]|uniref:helix-turn-helix domain-containing protein n=1 Tax=Gemmobacter sp. TaxID=1898957 RepID=UPI00391BF36B
MHQDSPQNKPAPQETAAARLRALREEAGLSLQAMADRMGIPLGTYRHYEERLKGPFMPQDRLLQLLRAFDGTSITPDRVRALGDLAAGGSGFSDTPPGASYNPQPHRGAALLRALDSAEAPEQQQALKIGTDGRYVQVIATVDREGLDRLIRRLEAMREVLD